MAPGGQGTLVDVCDGKSHPQRPVWTLARPRHPGGPGWGLGGQPPRASWTQEASKCWGWGSLRDYHVRRGNRPREGRT